MQRGFTPIENLPTEVKKTYPSIVEIVVRKNAKAEKDPLTGKMKNPYFRCTAFLVTPKMLVTARHCFAINHQDPFALEAASFNNARFSIYNFAREEVFKTNSSTDRILNISNKCEGRKNAPITSTEKIEPSQCDFVFVSLSRELSNISHLNQGKDPSSEETVFVLGYAGPTTTFFLRGGSDSDAGLNATTALVQTIDDIIYAHQDYFEKTIPSIKKAVEKDGNAFWKTFRRNGQPSSDAPPLFYFQGDTAGGMSGGPIINSKGQWVGILIRGDDDTFEKVVGTKPSTPWDGVSTGIKASWILQNQPE